MKKTRIFLFLIAGSFSLFPQEYYRSNSMAMELEILDGNSDWSREEGWILEARTEGFSRQLILFHDRIEKNRFEKQFSPGGRLLYSSRLKGRLLQEETFYDLAGNVERENFYNEEGTLIEEKTYHYSKEGILESVEILKAGQLPLTQNYSLRQDGSLRSVEIESSDSLLNRSSVVRFNESLYMDEQREGDVRVVRYRNQEGQLMEKVRYQAGKMILREKRNYSEAGLLSDVVVEDISSGKKNIRIMNEMELVEKEELYRNDEFQERTLFFYDSDLLVRKERRGTGFRESWFFRYEGDTLSEEDFYERGVLVYRKKYDRDDQKNYIQELYDGDELFMKVYFRKEVKIREEFISAGEVTRTREWGDS
ncbi:MAG: hypothetical protein JXR86_17370 [Spirochaetales bacterium]|nr:hypothetical protein [Spirochaetales bacterium]